MILFTMLVCISALRGDDSLCEVKYRFHHEGPAVGFAVSNNGKIAGTFGWDNKIKLWDLSNGKQIGVAMSHDHWVYDIQFSLKDDYLVSAGGDGYLKLWKIPDCSILATSPQHSWAVFRSTTRDPEKLITASTDELVTLWKWNDKKLQVLGRLPHKGFAGATIILEKQDRLLTSGTNNLVQLWDIKNTQSSILKYQTKEDVTRMFASEDFQYIAVAVRSGGAVLIDSVTLQMKVDLSLKSSVYRMAISKTSKYVAAGDSAGNYKVVGLNKLAPLSISQKMPSGIADIAFSDNEKHIVIGCSDGSVYLAAISSPLVPQLLFRTKQAINKLKFVSGDSCVLLANGENDVLMLELLPKTK